MSSGDIKNNLNKIKSQNQNLKKVVDSGYSVTPLLVDIVETLPSKMWITKFSYTEDAPGKGTGNRSFMMEGSINSGTRDGRDDLNLGNKFRDDLVKWPSVSRICGTSAVINYSNVVGASRGGNANSSVLTNRKGSTPDAQATHFTLTCAKVGGK